MSSRTRSPGFSLEATPIGKHRGREASALTHFVGRRPLNLLEPLRRFPPPAEMREGELAGLADGRSESWIAVMDANGFFNAEITHSSPQHLPSPPPPTHPPPEEVRMYFTHHYALETRRANQACNLLPLSKPLADKHAAVLGSGVLRFRFQWEFSWREGKNTHVHTCTHARLCSPQTFKDFYLSSYVIVH